VPLHGSGPPLVRGDHRHQALAAFVCGDRSVRGKGYLTLDPVLYTDV